ncbi:hypothetical protein [Nocardia sp. CS682]|uniref:hypothetical protein n=1 Tax=Nocardia sp. CS682 TaxID=1047172 RepID=UPI0010751F8E|nr:hypothetical protein [Nocardia sp. CS682]
MNDAPTAQDLLHITSSATARARRAASMPGWVPPVAALLGGIGVMLLGLGGDSADTVVSVCGYGVCAACFALLAWVWRAQRKGGVVPRFLSDEPTRRWQRLSLLVLPPLLAGIVGGLVNGWLHVLFGAFVGGWLWFGLRRQRAATCPS